MHHLKRARNLVLKAVSFLITSVLGLFCDFTPAMYGPAPMYGAPYIPYQINGTVSSKKDSTPIPGIEISLRDRSGAVLQSTISDSLGKFVVRHDQSNYLTRAILSASDIDGAKEGNFVQKDSLIEFPVDNAESAITQKVDLFMDEKPE